MTLSSTTTLSSRPLFNSFLILYLPFHLNLLLPTNIFTLILLLFSFICLFFLSLLFLLIGERTVLIEEKSSTWTNLHDMTVSLRLCVYVCVVVLVGACVCMCLYVYQMSIYSSFISYLMTHLIGHPFMILSLKSPIDFVFVFCLHPTLNTCHMSYFLF